MNLLCNKVRAIDVMLAVFNFVIKAAFANTN